jgi:hypothetical protein
MKKLPFKEAADARKRGNAYEYSLAIEGLFLHPEDKAVIEVIERERMDYDHAVQYMIDHLKKKGVVPTEPILVPAE